MAISQLITRIFRTINWKQFSVSIYYCPICSGNRIFIKLNSNEISIRCFSCRATSITLSLVTVMRSVCPEISSMVVYELSSRGSLKKFLEQSSKTLYYSEYFKDVSPGSYIDGIQCQDVQRLTYPKEKFDLCTSTEVFEHIPDDVKGFSEIFRVLKPKGIFIFTVPLDVNNKTIERVIEMPNGKIEYRLSPEYHYDPIRGYENILVYRNYGYDILDKLKKIGFKKAEFFNPENNMAWGYSRTVIVAYRE